MHFDADARHALRALADFFQDCLPGRALARSGFQFDGDRPICRPGRVMALPEWPDVAIDVLQPVDALDALLDAHDKIALLDGRKIAARRDIDVRHVGIGVDEEYRRRG